MSDTPRRRPLIRRSALTSLLWTYIKITRGEGRVGKGEKKRKSASSRGVVKRISKINTVKPKKYNLKRFDEIQNNIQKTKKTMQVEACKHIHICGKSSTHVTCQHGGTPPWRIGSWSACGQYMFIYIPWLALATIKTMTTWLVFFRNGCVANRTCGKTQDDSWGLRHARGHPAHTRVQGGPHASEKHRCRTDVAQTSCTT